MTLDPDRRLEWNLVAPSWPGDVRHGQLLHDFNSTVTGERRFTRRFSRVTAPPIEHVIRRETLHIVRVHPVNLLITFTGTALALLSSVAGCVPAGSGEHAVTQSFTATAAAIAAVALLTVALPGPIMLDMLGAGLASLGLGMICDIG